MEVTESLLEENRNLEELNTINKYFEMLYHFRGDNLDKKGIMEKFRKGNFQFAGAAREFKLIEDTSKTVFVPKEEEAQKILTQIKTKGFTKELVRQMGHYCVNIDENDFKKMYASGMLGEMTADTKEEYFVLKSLEKYTQEMGLILDV